MVDEKALLRRIWWRVIPFLCFCSFVNFLDRTNIGVAGLTMNQALGLSPSIFGFAAAVFFISYLLFEVPSNIVMERVGPRIWLARIMISWGLVTVFTAAVVGPYSLYAARFLLGAAEAGFKPAFYFFLTCWFLERQRGLVIGTFEAILPVTGLIGTPLSTMILTHLDQAGGYAGWQWLFVLEGIPSVIAGIMVLFVLYDRPRNAPWINEAEKRWLEGELAEESKVQSRGLPSGKFSALVNLRVWAVILVMFTFNLGLYGTGFWLPQILKSLGMSTSQIGYVAMVPYAAASVAIVSWGWFSGKSKNHGINVAIPAAVGAIGFLITYVFLDKAIVAVLGLSIAMVGIYAIIPAFWRLTISCMHAAALAVGVAFVNSVGNLGGALGSFLVGFVVDWTGNYSSALLFLGAAMCVSSATAFSLRSRRGRETEETMPEFAGLRER